MPNLQYKQDIMAGTVVGVDLLDMDANSTPDCSNVDIFTPGQMSNVGGIEKQATTGYVDSVVAIHQLEDMSKYTIVGIA